MAFNLFKKKKWEPKSTPTSEVGAPTASVGVAAPATGLVLKRFFISEKSARGQSFSQYTFEVAKNATKTDVKHAVQRTYKVTVSDVNMVRLPSKKRTVGRYQGTKSGIKKAIVTLKDGETIAQAQP